MKMVEIKTRSNFNLELGVDSNLFLVEDKDLKKVWEHNLNLLKKVKKTGMNNQNLLISDMKSVIDEYQKTSRQSQGEIEIEKQFTYLYMNSEQNIYEFGAILEDTRIEIKITDINVVRESGVTIINKKEGELVV